MRFINRNDRSPEGCKSISQGWSGATPLVNETDMASTNRKVLPGFSLSLSYTVFYLGVLVLLPISACLFRAGSLSFDEFWSAVWTERARAAYMLTFGAAFIAAVANLVLGLMLAWVLVRYSFPGKKIVDSLIDLPLALPTATQTVPTSALY